MSFPAYVNLSEQEFEERIKEAYSLLEECCLCPHRCKTRRKEGQTGICRCGILPVVSSCNAHHGEEPPVSGLRGSGTIFFTNCNMRCCFCQNYPISQLGNGSQISVRKLADMMLSLQQQGCYNVNFVTPTPWTPQILDALKLAREKGLRIPLVYNSSGYDSLEQLKLLDGIVDIYLPDMKYAEADIAKTYSGIPNYPAVNKTAVREMYRQVGDLQIDENGIAQRGLIIRHLVLPNNLAGSKRILEFIAQEISPETYVSLMGQYFPAYKAHKYPQIARRITSQEYQQAVGWLHNFKLENGWIQEDYL